jgi:hypothetical protein
MTQSGLAESAKGSRDPQAEPARMRLRPCGQITARGLRRDPKHLNEHRGRMTGTIDCDTAYTEQAIVVVRVISHSAVAF